jgi:phosphate transporter
MSADGNSYDALKKFIYQLERQQYVHHIPDLESNERSSLLTGEDTSGTDAIFIPLLDRELKKIVLFYEHQKKELVDDLNDLEKDIELQEEIGLLGDHYADYEDGDNEDDDDSINASRSPDGTRRSQSRHRKLSSAGRTRRGSRT